MAIKKQLDDFYKAQWTLQKQLATAKSFQDRLIVDNNQRQDRVKQLMLDKEFNMKEIREGKKISRNENARCQTLEEKYGYREAVRQEDLENVVKLVSLLRSLYTKKARVGPF